MFLKKDDSCHAEIRHSFKCIKIFGSCGFIQDPTGLFTTLPKTHEFGWDRNLVRAHLWQIPGSATGKKIDKFRFNYTPDCTVLSMIFNNFSRRGSYRNPSPFNLASPSIRASPQFTHPNMFIFSPAEGTSSNTIIPLHECIFGKFLDQPLGQRYSTASPRGEWGSGPPLLFRPLLRLAQIRWKVFIYI